jgi:hypothetical protein
MDVVGHNHERVEIDVGKRFQQFVPPLDHHSTSIALEHVTVDDLAKQACPILDTGGHEVKSGLPVIVSA